MNAKMIGWGLALVLTAAGIAGCKTTTATSTPATSVAVAKQACEINALAEERDAMVSTINTAAPEQGASAQDHRWTILKEKLRPYSAEVEASYRFVTANCNSYNLCMDMNGYNEHACADSRRAWVESHAKFNELSIAISDVKHGHGGHGGHKPGGDCHRSDCNVQGGVFATGCCHDGD